jgi:hypothetical protein
MGIKRWSNSLKKKKISEWICWSSSKNVCVKSEKGIEQVGGIRICWKDNFENNWQSAGLSEKYSY